MWSSRKCCWEMRSNASSSPRRNAAMIVPSTVELFAEVMSGAGQCRALEIVEHQGHGDARAAGPRGAVKRVGRDDDVILPTHGMLVPSLCFLRVRSRAGISK